MKILNYLLIGGLTLLGSCTNNEIIEQRVEIENLSLNDGEKWLANQETTDGVNNMIDLLDGSHESINAIHLLAQDLAIEKDQIFKQCDMTGEAHNNLHSFLLPLIKMINQLEEAETIAKANDMLVKIKLHLKEYDFFFKN